MNNIKMGKFIKEMRIQKFKTQANLVDKLNEKYINVTVKAISDWKNGKTIPDVEKLIELAILFDVTIDEILDGELCTQKNLQEEYFLSKHQWEKDYENNKTACIYSIRQEQIIKINKVVNELIYKRIKGYLAVSEEKEFQFLITNFYCPSDYCKNKYNLNIKHNYLLIITAINKCLKQLEGNSETEIIWEIKKIIVPNSIISLKQSELNSIVDNYYAIERSKNLDLWEKDFILSCFQFEDFISYDPNIQGSYGLKLYEEYSGQEFNKEQKTKDIIKCLINNGACINHAYLSFNNIIKEKRRIIDRLEEIYHFCKEPIKGIINIDGVNKIYYVKNTKKNRFLHNYYNALSHDFDYSFEELYNFVINNDYFTEEMLDNAIQKYNINTDRERKYILSDLNMYISYSKERFKEFKKEEALIENYLKEYDELYELLKKGEIYYDFFTKELVGGNDWNYHKDFCYAINQSLTEDEFFKSRNKDATIDLLNNIDSLSVQEIRNKYFAVDDRHDK